jgi:hypothetical protein
MKLCKDCKHFQYLDNVRDPLCGHAQAVSFDDPVFGKHTRKSCKDMRANRHLCGPFGTLFANPEGFVAGVIES